MNCPVDNEVLQMSERQGVEVDYCPRCRGVWLDRGELDKIIERVGEELARSGVDEGYDRDRDRQYYERDDRRRYDDDRDWQRQRSYGHRKKKRSFLSDMFEFGGGGDD